MKLYYSPGAASLAPHIALLENEQRFDLERVDMRAHRTASGQDFLAINPKGNVPALELDEPGQPMLTEAPAILEYVADLAPGRGLAPPAGTFARYRLTEWLAFFAAEVSKHFGPLSAPETPPAVSERARNELASNFSYVDGVLDKRPFLMGERFTVADCYLIALARWGERYDIDLARWPSLCAAYQRGLARPAVEAAFAAEGLVEFRRFKRSA